MSGGSFDELLREAPWECVTSGVAVARPCEGVAPMSVLRPRGYRMRRARVKRGGWSAAASSRARGGNCPRHQRGPALLALGSRAPWIASPRGPVLIAVFLRRAVQPVSVAEPRANREVVACMAAGSWVQQVAGTNPLPQDSCCGEAGRREGCREEVSTAAGRPLELVWWADERSERHSSVCNRGGAANPRLDATAAARCRCWGYDAAGEAAMYISAAGAAERPDADADG